MLQMQVLHQRMHKARLQAVVKPQQQGLGSVFAISTAASLTLGWHTLTILPPVIGDGLCGA